MSEKYYLNKIRSLLLHGFKEQDLRSRLPNDDEFSDLPAKIPERAGLEDIVNEVLLPYAERQGKMDDLLRWAQKENPVVYQEYLPYHRDTAEALHDLWEFFTRLRPAEPTQQAQPPVAQGTGRIRDWDAWDVAQVKSILHGIAEHVIQEAQDQAPKGNKDPLQGLVPLTYDLRWRRHYLAAINKIIDATERCDGETPDVLANELRRNLEVLVRLVARMKMPGSEWLLPDQEGLTGKPGHSLLGNEIPDYDYRKELEAVQAQLADQKAIEEHFILKRNASSASGNQSFQDLKNAVAKTLPPKTYRRRGKSKS